MSSLIMERRKTRKLKWIIDISGNAGKSIYTDILERTPGIKALRLTLDYYRSFKFQSAKLISDYSRRHGYPDVILIDAPRDEESKFLHDIYGALEEINNGRLEGSFGGKIIKDSIPRNVPIIVLSNSPPIEGALSEDRWDIMAIYNYVGDEGEKEEVYIQKARVSSNVKDITGNLVYWQNFIKTVIDLDIDQNYESGRLLAEMQRKNIKLTELLIKKEEALTKQKSKLLPGQIERWSGEKVATLSKAPSYVLLQARNKMKFMNKNG